MNVKKTPLQGCKLPLVMAIGSVILVGCSNTTPMNNGAKVTTVPAAQRGSTVPPGNQQPIGQAPVATTEAVSQVPATDSTYSKALLDDDSLEELANLLEATDMTMVEDDKLAIQQYGDLWDRMRAGFRLDQSQYQYNPRIEAQKSWFTTRQDYINRLTARASRYLYHTVSEAERRNIPTELALLPVIESSYDPTASSNASASGMWQFIPSTGRIYGLTQTPTYDGRRDVVESTRAAYDFLTSLYNQFGSWELALAAYNAGPGRVQNAIDANRAQGLPTDFWSLNLPQETMNYVPRFMAVAQIVADAKRYGIYLPAIANRQHFRSVPVKYGVSLQQVSQITGVDYEELRMLNPALVSAQVDIAGPNRMIIPNSVAAQIDSQLSQLAGNDATGPYVANIPDDQYETLSQSAEGLAEFATKARAPKQNENYIVPVATATAEPAISATEKNFINSQFQSFNTLPTTSASVTVNDTIIQEPPLSPEEKAFIAAQIRSLTPDVGQVVSPIDGNVNLEAVQTQQSILEANGQEKRLSFAPSQRPTPPPVTTSTPRQAATSSAPSVPKGARSVYTVQRGDTLSSIASRAGLSWRDIADWNQMNPNATLLSGTKLYLYNAKPITPLSAPATDTNSEVKQEAQANTYTVRAGDTLIGTAERVGLSVSQLARYNSLSTQAQLKTGEKLWLIPGMIKDAPSKSPTTTIQPQQKTQLYTVKKGESLNSLAASFDVPVATLAAMNDLSPTDALLIGQRLTIPATATQSASGGLANTTANSATVSDYKVKAGDTLIGIANKLSVAHTQIAALNNFSASTKIQRGQVIKLPVDSQQVALALDNQSIDYKVQGGDTLIGVADKFSVSVNNLARANKLAVNAQLIKGSTITIPNKEATAKGNESQTAPTKVVATQSSSKSTASTAKDAAVQPESYTVKSGDTLIGLANKFGVSVSDLAAANNLNMQSQVQIGQKLSLPATTGTEATSGTKASSAAPTPAPLPTSQTASASASQYTVQSGDSLIQLAQKNGLSTEQLAQANHLKPDAQLQIGQKLSLPATTTTYKVMEGDNLISLAKKYGMTAKQFADLNHIQSDAMLQKGQVLKVPVQ